MVYKAWTEDISASGMQFVCDSELPPGDLFVSILLPELEGRIVACEVVRFGQREGRGHFRKNGPQYFYGVRFQQIRDLREFEASVGQDLWSNAVRAEDQDEAHHHPAEVAIG
jgi:glucose/arabinose dehydrogenase